jgi:hypothetical protein
MSAYNEGCPLRSSVIEGIDLPRYYIDIRSHFGIDEDPSGIDLPDIAAAQSEALKVVQTLLQSWAAMTPNYSDEIFIEIVGEDLRPVLIIPCSDIKTVKR